MYWRNYFIGVDVLFCILFIFFLGDSFLGFEGLVFVVVVFVSWLRKVWFSEKKELSMKEVGLIKLFSIKENLL